MNQVKMILTLTILFSFVPFVYAINIGGGEIGIDLIPVTPTNFSALNVNNSQFLNGFTSDEFWQTANAQTGLTGDKTGSFDLVTTGTGRFDGGLTDENANVVVYPYGQLLQDITGISAIRWNDRILMHGDGSTTTIDWDNQRLQDDSGTLAMTWLFRQLSADDGSDIILDWDTPGLAQFGDSKVITTGTLNASATYSLGGSVFKDVQPVGTKANAILHIDATGGNWAQLSTLSLDIDGVSRASLQVSKGSAFAGFNSYWDFFANSETGSHKFRTWHSPQAGGSTAWINWLEVEHSGDVVINQSDLRVGNAISSNNITMFSPDGTEYTCGVANGGAFSCS